MQVMAGKTIVAIWAAVALAASPGALASDSDDLRSQVQDFLANADDEATHASFWADDLVYTSSAGLRFGKAEIMSGFSGADVDNDGDSDDAHDKPVVRYSGQDINTRVYGDMAVVTFKLIGRPADGTMLLGYFNTGVFLRQNGRWQAVAWQATKIPPT